MFKKALTFSVFSVLATVSNVSAASAAVEGEKVRVSIAETGIFVTDLTGSLNAVVNQLIMEQVEKQCNPLKSAKNLDLHVTLDRWVNGSDTQSVSIEGSAICSRR